MFYANEDTFSLMCIARATLVDAIPLPPHGSLAVITYCVRQVRDGCLMLDAVGITWKYM